MKVLVYPHDLGMGGSQLNAVELGAAVRDLGHDVVVYGRPGVLAGRVAELGLELVVGVEPGRRPSPRVATELRGLVADRGLDVVHGYEWPPILEARLAVRGRSAVAVGTVMSMAVAPFVPRHVPLVVGTRQIADHEQRQGRSRVGVIEPPVDTATNNPEAVSGEQVDAFAAQHGIPEGMRTVVVSRLAPELKLEGLLAAIDVVPTLAPDSVLVVVGGGPADLQVKAAAQVANGRAGRRAVVVTGEVHDPRPAYAMADVALGMGGSALRAMAFGAPVVVQGEQGFWSTLTAATLPEFGWTGWYGIGAGAAEGRARLRTELAPLLANPARRRELGDLSLRTVLEGYSLQSAARRQVEVYAAALEHRERHGAAGLGREDLRAASRLASYKFGRLSGRLRRRHRSDDFNAVPVAARSTRPSAETTALTAPAAESARSGGPR